MSDKLIFLTSGELKLLLTDVVNDCLASNTKVTLEPSTKPGNATRQEASEYLGITKPTLHKLTLEGKIKGNRVGRRVLYRWADLDSAMNAINTKDK